MITSGLQRDFGDIVGLADSMHSMRLSSRQFVRRVLLFVKQRKQPSKGTMQTDPLAQFPARIRELVCDIVDSYGSQRGLNFDAIVNTELGPGQNLCTESLEALPTVVEQTSATQYVSLRDSPSLKGPPT